jgi:hypothetical protein
MTALQFIIHLVLRASFVAIAISIAMNISVHTSCCSQEVQSLNREVFSCSASPE